MTPKAKAQPTAQPKPKKRKRRSKKLAAARRRGRERRLAERSSLFARLASMPNDAVLTLSEWWTLNSLSERAGRRLLADGEGPVLTKLSEKLRGVTIRNNRAWQESREQRAQ